MHMRKLRPLWTQLHAATAAQASVKPSCQPTAHHTSRVCTWTKAHERWCRHVHAAFQRCVLPASHMGALQPLLSRCYATGSAGPNTSGNTFPLPGIKPMAAALLGALTGMTCAAATTTPQHPSNSPSSTSPVHSSSASASASASPSLPGASQQRALVPLGPCCSQPYSFPTHKLRFIPLTSHSTLGGHSSATGHSSVGAHSPPSSLPLPAITAPAPASPSPTQTSASTPASMSASGSAEALVINDAFHGQHRQHAAQSTTTISTRAPRTREPVVLVSCGSFNPPTTAHMRMCDVAVTALEQAGHPVLGVYLSPVGDGYGKPGLAPACDRLAMCEAASVTHPLVMCDRWEPCQPAGYTRTLAVLRHVTDEVEAWWGRTAGLRSGSTTVGPQSDGQGGSQTGAAGSQTQPQQGGRSGVRVMLLCGGDVLESMQKPGVWRDPDVLLAQHGVVCVVRPGTDVSALLDTPGGLLHRSKEHIVVATDGCPSPLSSTAVRAALREGRSLEGLVPPGVSAYLAMHKGLYRQ